MRANKTVTRLIVTTALCTGGGLAPFVSINVAYATQVNGTAADNASADQPTETIRPSQAQEQVSSTDIIVTAQRRSQKLENVPASVVAISGDALRTSGVTRFQDLGLITPSVQIARSGTFVQPAIRGITTTFAGPGQEANVAVYIDGIYQSDLLAINQDFSNISDVQILKGPQGTLYGRNATGGAILISTKSPTDTFEATASVSYAPRFDDKQFATFIGGPIANGVKLSLAGYFRNTDGYIKDINGFAPNAPIRFDGLVKRSGNDSSPFRNWAIRPKLVVEVGSDATLTFGYAHTFVNDPRSNAYSIVGNASNPAASYSGYAVANQRDRTSLNFQPVNESKSNDYTVIAEIRMGSAGTLVGHGGIHVQRDFQEYDLDGTPRDPINTPGATAFSAYNFYHRRTINGALDYSNDVSDRFSLLSGLFFYKDDFDVTQGVEDTGGAGNPTSYVLPFNTRTLSGYVDGTYKFGETLFLTVGGRYSSDRKDLSRTRFSSAGVVIPAMSSPGIVRTKNNAFTPRAVLRYNFAAGANVYASVSRGFKAGTIANAPPFNTLKPETVTAYEIGIKTNSGKVRTEFSSFYYDYHDNQVSAINPNVPGSSSLTLNSGGSEIYGADASVSAALSRAFNVRVNFGYLHARYTDFDNATNLIVRSGTTTNSAVVGSWTGRRIARSPDFSGSVNASYTTPLAGGTLVATGTASFSSRFAPQNSSYQCPAVGILNGATVPFGTVGSVASCDPTFDGKHAPGRFEENGYVLGSASLAWTEGSGRFTVTLYSENATNTRYKVITNGLSYHSYEMFNEPRTVGMRLGFRY